MSSLFGPYYDGPKTITPAEFRHWLMPQGEAPEVDSADSVDGGPGDDACNQSPRILYDAIKSYPFSVDDWSDFVDAALASMPSVAESDAERPGDRFPQDVFFEALTFDMMFADGFLYEWPTFADSTLLKRIADYADGQWDNLGTGGEPGQG